MNTNFQVKPLSLVIAALLATASIGTHASGFAITENSAAGMGNAFAGGAAIAEDASTVFFNPAGMSRLEGTQVIFAGHIIAPSFDFSNQGSNVNPQLTGGTPVAGSLPGKNADSSVVGLVPNNYFVSQINDRLHAGIGINAPFGLETNYDKDWVGRYQALQSKILTININPAVSYRINEKFSVGVGVNAQYIRATLSQAIDFGTVCFGLEGQGSFPAGTCAATGNLPTAVDGQGKIKGSDWSWGFNLGALFELSDATRVGVHYRSSISHDLTGKGTFRVPASFPTTPAFSDTNVTTGIDLPESASVSLFHQFNERIAVMGDLTWTNWEKFDEVVVEYDNPSQPQTTLSPNWGDSMRYSLGLTYTPSDVWTFRTGVAYDESPVADKDRTARIPSNDTTWVTIGLGHKLNEHITLNMGYAHLFVNDTPLNETDTSTGHVLIGEYAADFNIFSGGIQYKF